MKITKRQLKRIIREEKRKIVREVKDDQEKWVFFDDMVDIITAKDPIALKNRIQQAQDEGFSVEEIRSLFSDALHSADI